MVIIRLKVSLLNVRLNLFTQTKIPFLTLILCCNVKQTTFMTNVTGTHTTSSILTDYRLPTTSIEKKSHPYFNKYIYTDHFNFHVHVFRSSFA